MSGLGSLPWVPSWADHSLNLLSIFIPVYLISKTNCGWKAGWLIHINIPLLEISSSHWKWLAQIPFPSTPRSTKAYPHRLHGVSSVLGLQLFPEMSPHTIKVLCLALPSSFVLPTLDPLCLSPHSSSPAPLTPTIYFISSYQWDPRILP